MRSKHLDQNIDRLYHPEKGVARSNNERRRCNKFPDEPPTTNHNIAGTSKIWTETVHDTAVSPSKHFKPPNNANKFVNENDKSGKPNYWSIDGQLLVSQTGHALCGYWGIPSHSREICKLRMQDEVEGEFYNAHPNRGKILSKNQSTKQLQPAEGASYHKFKKHLYYNKDRVRSIQSQSRQVNDQDGDDDGWDYNHNPSFQNGKNTAKPTQNPKAKVQPQTATPKELIKYRAKWATDNNIAEVPQINQNGLSDMPAEILKKILGHLSFTQRIGIQRINQRFKEVTLTPKLWKNITIRGCLITNQIIIKILRSQTTSFDLPDCVWRAYRRKEIEAENYLILNPPKLTYLGLQGFGGNNGLAATLILLSKNLATLDLSEADFTLLSHVEKIDRTNHITSINLSIMKTPPRARQPSALYEMYSPIRANTIADLTTKCIRLTDLVLCGSNLSQDSIVQICNLVTPTLVAINLARERIKDEHVDSLTLRCPNMKYINLAKTRVSYRIVPHIASRWRYSMRDLSLPEQIAR